MSNGTKVIKRSGEIESLDLDKMHIMVEEACKNLAGVSASQVEMKSGIQFYDGITTAEIQEILIRSASDLIDLDHPNYQYVAARLLLFSVRKQLYGKMMELPHLEEHIYYCVNQEVYDSDIFNKYSKEEIDTAILLFVTIEITYSLMLDFAKLLISTSFKIGVVVEYMKPHSLCT